MLRHTLSGAAVLLAGFFVPALADAGGDQAADLQAAIAACDKGASVPLDPDAKSPPVHFADFFGAAETLDKAALDAARTLAEQCKRAFDGAPDQKRLRLEWLRAAYFARLVDFGQSTAAEASRQPQFAQELRAVAATGSAEANFLLFSLYRSSPRAGEGGPAGGITRQEALQGLLAAADAGHLQAMSELFYEYRNGPDLRRDAMAALRMADRIMNLPRQGPEPVTSPFEAQMRRVARVNFAEIALSIDGVPTQIQARGFAIAKEMFDAKDPGGTIPFAMALRYGRGTPGDASAARAVLESAFAARQEQARAPLADMLAKGEGGPVDGKRALALLKDKDAAGTRAARHVLAGLYLDNRFVGRQPRQAIRLLTATVGDIDGFIRAADLLRDYQEPLTHASKHSLPDTLTAAALAREPGAAMALARLKLSDNSDFQDVDGARILLYQLSVDGDSEAAVLYAETQYANLMDSAFRPSRRGDVGITDRQIEDLLRDLTARKQASAFRLKAELLRAGVVFPQDDEAATKALISAAELGDVTAMVMLGKAYDDGLGIAKDPRERLRWWREAAKRGSLQASRELADAFIFDFSDRLLTLREGVTERVALYNNEGESSGPVGGMATMDVARAFGGGRASEAGVAAVAGAVMDGLREAPAGLAEDKLVPLAKVMPDEIRIAIEKALKDGGFYAGEASGSFGPEVRKALAAWVDAKGPLPDEGEPSNAAIVSPAGSLPPDLVNRLRTRALKAVNDAKTPQERDEAIGLVSDLARNGDIASRYALVRNYDDAPFVRVKVTPEEVTRYGLDLLVTRPQGVEKIEDDFIFDITTLFQERQTAAFGSALIAAVRDDPRLQDPLTLGRVMHQLIFAPEACDAIAKAASDAAMPGIGADGCDEATRTALIAFAKAKGPAGVESAAREAAAIELRKMDAALPQ